MSQRRHILLLENGDDVLTSQKIFVIQNKTFTVGCSTSNDMIVKSGHLAREQAMFSFNSYSDCELIDRSHQYRSQNGTFVNGEQVARHVLTHGDLIEFGKALRGLYLSQVLCGVQLFYYLEEISRFLSFSAPVIEQIKHITPIKVGHGCTTVTKLA